LRESHVALFQSRDAELILLAEALRRLPFGHSVAALGFVEAVAAEL